MINFGNLSNSYAKHNTNYKTLERVMLAPHYPPKEHKLDNKVCTDKQIYTICQRGSSSAPSKTDSFNRRKLTVTVMNAFGKHLNMGGRVGQEGGSRAPIPKALEGANKEKTHAVQVFLRTRQEAAQCGINQGDPKRWVDRYGETTTKGSMGPCPAETSRTPS